MLATGLESGWRGLPSCLIGFGSLCEEGVVVIEVDQELFVSGRVSA